MAIMGKLNFFLVNFVLVAIVKVEGASVQDFFTNKEENILRDDNLNSGNLGRYLNSWAVKIHGGPVEADATALKYGFNNLGLVR